MCDEETTRVLDLVCLRHVPSLNTLQQWVMTGKNNQALQNKKKILYYIY